MVLSRKDGQRITLTTGGGETIEVVIDRMQRGTARVSINAPQSVKVMRSEVIERILQARPTPAASQADNGTAGH